MRWFAVLMVSTFLCAGSAAAQSAHVDLVLPAPSELATQPPTVRTIKVLSAGRTAELIRNGFPARLHYKLERWAAGTFVNDVKAALYCSKICSYAQGMALLAAANKPTDKGGFDFHMNLPDLPMIWRAGCIIRAVFLEEITKAFKTNPNLPNLLTDDKFQGMISQRQDAWRRVVN